MQRKSLTDVSVPMALMLSAMLAVNINAEAGTRTYEDAARIAANYVELPAMSSRAAGITSDTDRPYYIFNDRNQGHGFVIIAGRDDIHPVLGYADKGSIDEASMPDALATMLANVPSMKASVTSGTKAQATVVVEPLIQTQWYQLEPYNGKLPQPKLFTCCVATAMAQIMNYHRWPEQGHGQISYESAKDLSFSDDTHVGPLSIDLSQSTYDWDNMLPTYADGNWTPEQADAVATLMRDCGYAIHAQYAIDESTSYAHDLAAAFVENFGYDSEVYPNFGELSPDQWRSIIKADLDAGFPGAISGFGSIFGGGGHCFVVDGYDSDDYFHINWGWNGDADGFFNTELLTPVHHGEQLNYSFMQFYVSAHPRRPYTDSRFNGSLVMLWDIKNQTLDHSGLTIENPDAFASGNADALIRLDGLVYIADRGYTGTFSLDLLDASGNKVKTLASVPVHRDQLGENLQDQTIGPKTIDIPAASFSGLPDGTYRIVPVGTMGNMEPIRVQAYGYKRHLLLTVADGKASIANVPAPQTDLCLMKGLDIPARIPLFTHIDTDIQIRNDGDFMVGGVLSVEACPEGSDSHFTLGYTKISINPGTTLSIPFKLDFIRHLSRTEAPDFEEGKTYMITYTLVDNAKEPIPVKNDIDNYVTTITVDPSLLPTLEITGLKITDRDGNTIPLDNPVLSLDNDYTFTYDYRTISPGAAPYGVKEFDISFGENSSSSLWNPTSGTTTYSTDFEWLPAPPGEHYVTFLYSDYATDELVMPQPQSLAKIKVTLTDNSGVGTVATDEAAVETARYNTLGIRLGHPAAGINIVHYSDGTIRKVMVK